MKRNTDSPINNEKRHGNSTKAMSEKPNMSPKLYRHPLSKEKIDMMVKPAYKEESDSVKVSRLCYSEMLCKSDFSSFTKCHRLSLG